MQKEQTVKSRKLSWSKGLLALLSLAVLAAGQLLSQSVGTLLSFAQFPVDLCNLAVGVVYVLSVLYGVSWVCKALGLSLADCRILPVHFSLLWTVIALAMPGIVCLILLNLPGSDVDPVGACVGVRGSRIQNIVQELHGERIDIVVWSPEISTYARNALAPAVISRIVVDEAENLLEVTVPDDQLTSAIGRKGQNVKLAAKLLGWKIDIFTETRYNETNAIGRGLEQVASVAEVSVDSLVSAGFTTLEQLQDATDEELSEKLSLSDSRIGDLRAAINFLSPVVGESADKADADADKADETAAGEDE